MSKPEWKRRPSGVWIGDYRRELSDVTRRRISSAFKIRGADLDAVAAALEKAVARELAFDAMRRPTKGVERDALATIRRQALDLRQSLNLRATSALQHAPLLKSAMYEAGIDQGELVRDLGRLAGLCAASDADLPKGGGRRKPTLPQNAANAVAEVLVDAGIDIGRGSGLTSVLQDVFRDSGIKKYDLRSVTAAARRSVSQ